MNSAAGLFTQATPTIRPTANEMSIAFIAVLPEQQAIQRMGGLPPPRAF
jgi:hypothetical protein